MNGKKLCCWKFSFRNKCKKRINAFSANLHEIKIISVLVHRWKIKFEPKYLEVDYHEPWKIKNEIFNIINYSKPMVI